MCDAHDTCFSAGKIRKFFTCGGPVEVVQSCFGTRNALKFSFDNCRGMQLLLFQCWEDQIKLVLLSWRLGGHVSVPRMS